MVDNPTPAVEVNLLPCPFCGGPAVNVAGEYITCGSPLFLDCAGRSVKADVDVWNTRTPSRGGEVAKLREALTLLRGDDANPYSFSGDGNDQGKVITQHRYCRWGEDCVIAIGELNWPNQWDDEAFDAKVDALTAALASPPPVDADTPAASEGAVPAGDDVNAPERIWLCGYGTDHGDISWSSCPNPTDDPEVDGKQVEYVRVGYASPKPASEGAVSAGFVLVPVEPTEAMRLEMAAAETRAEIWPAMLAASPKPASDTGTRVEAGEGLTSGPDGCVWRSGHDGEGPDPSRFFCDVIGPPPSCHLYRAVADTEAEARRLAFEKADPTFFERQARIDHGASEALGEMVWTTAPKATATGGVRDHAGSVREAAERLLLAMSARSLRGRDHVPSMRDEQDAASALRAALHPVDSRAQGGEK